MSLSPMLTANTGFCDEKNDEFLYRHSINPYIPTTSSAAATATSQHKNGTLINASQSNPPPLIQDDFTLNKRWDTCTCPAGEKLALTRVADNGYGNETAYFGADCRNAEAALS